MRSLHASCFFKLARLLFSEARNVRKARNPSGLVRTWLEDGSWIELLDDLEAARAHINEALAHQDRNACRKTEIAEEFRREVEIQRLLGLALADRKTPRDVAEIMRIPESEVREIVKTHGPALYTDRVVAAWLDPKELRRQVSQGLRAWKRKPILVDPLEDLE